MTSTENFFFNLKPSSNIQIFHFFSMINKYFWATTIEMRSEFRNIHVIQLPILGIWIRLTNFLKFLVKIEQFFSKILWNHGKNFSKLALGRLINAENISSNHPHPLENSFHGNNFLDPKKAYLLSLNNSGA